MSIVVVTHSLNTSPWFSEAMRSVQRWLPRNALHLVIDGREGLEALRPRALEGAEFVCFVDDDDVVLNDSIRLTYEALQVHPEAGVAFTSEQIVGPAGELLGAHLRTPTYADIATFPTAAHHLVMLRTRKVAPEAIEAARRAGAGIDWAMTASAALRHGAVHVPIFGCQWRRHEGSHSHVHRSEYVRALPVLRGAINRWKQTDAPIPQFLPGHGAPAVAPRSA